MTQAAPLTLRQKALYILGLDMVRINRSSFILSCLGISALFYLACYVVVLPAQKVLGDTAGLIGMGIIVALFFYYLISIAIRRMHDIDHAGTHLFIVFAPVIGIIFVLIELVLIEGKSAENEYGAPPAKTYIFGFELNKKLKV